MSIRVLSRVWEYSTHAGSDLLMLLAIADFADDEGNAYPAVATLATKCRMKPRNANYVLATLQRSGELEIRVNEGPKGTNRYRVALERLQAGVQSLAGVRMQTAAGVQSLAGLQRSAPTPATGCSKPLQPIADEPSLNRQEPRKTASRSTKRSRRSTSSIQNVPDHMLSEWMPLDSWHAFIEMRVSIKSPMTANAQVLLIKKLDRFRVDGHDVRELLDNAVINNWKSVYPNAAAKSGAKTDSDDLFRRGAA